jgi:Cu/Ag efflux protein CusF
MFYRVVSLFFVAVALSWVMSAPAQAADSHQGKIVETSAGKLVMTDMDGKKEHPMEVPASAAVTRDGKEAKLTDLKAGDTITVTTDTKDGKAMVTKVEAKAADM